MKKYKIGEVSKITGIPVENIRFFESKGLIKPEKDGNSNYRFYDNSDINRLYDYRKYRDIGLSVSESIHAIHDADKESITEILYQKQIEAEQNARYYELKALKLHNYRNAVKNIQLLEGECTIKRIPEGNYFIKRTYQNGKLYFDKASDWEGYFDQLMEKYAFVENIFRIRQKWIGNEAEKESYEWGFTIKKKWSEALNIPINEKMTAIKSVRAVFTIVKAVGDEPFNQSMLKPAFHYMEVNGYKLCGDILGNLLLVSHEEGKLVRYMELWIPIEE